MVVVSIASLKVTVREVFGATDEAESAGVVEESLSLLLLQEMMVRLKRDMRIKCVILFIFFLHQ